MFPEKEEKKMMNTVLAILGVITMSFNIGVSTETRLSDGHMMTVIYEPSYFEQALGEERSIEHYVFKDGTWKQLEFED